MEDNLQTLNDEINVVIEREKQKRIVAEAILEMRLQNLSIPKIAEILEMKENLVRFYIKKYFPHLSRVNLSGCARAPTERTLAIIAMRKDKRTYAEIGEQFGVSRERIRQIIDKNSQDMTGDYRTREDKMPCVECGILMRPGRNYAHCETCHKPHEKYNRYKLWLEKSKELYEKIKSSHASKEKYHLDPNGWMQLTQKYFPEFYATQPNKAHYFCKLYEERDKYNKKYEAKK